MPGNEAKAAPSRGTNIERNAKALRLRAKGRKFREIAEELGITSQRAQQIVSAGRAGGSTLATLPWAGSISPGVRGLLIRLGYRRARSVVDDVRSGKLHAGSAFGLGAARFAEITRWVEEWSRATGI